METDSQIQPQSQEFSEPQGFWAKITSVVLLVAGILMVLLFPAIVFVLFFVKGGLDWVVVLFGAFLICLGLSFALRLGRTSVQSKVRGVLLTILLFAIGGGIVYFGIASLQYKTVYTANFSSTFGETTSTAQFTVPGDLTASDKQHTVVFDIRYRTFTPGFYQGYVEINFSYPGGSFKKLYPLTTSSKNYGLPVYSQIFSNYYFTLQPGVYTFIASFDKTNPEFPEINSLHAEIREHR